MPRSPATALAAQPDLFAALPAHGVCGVDEAGRGPLAGSVFTGAVILDPARPIEGLRDSKQLTEARREALAEQIRERALAWAVASASVQEIDRLNILQATLLAMRRAVLALKLAPELVLVDGNRLPELPMEARAIVKGDALVPAISAASILAKCARDAEARELHAAYPGYGFDLHKGYGTELHMARLHSLGACPAHRASFAPVREALERSGGALTPPSAW
ncbi:ribonuclease HII [beta proteobacterium AAP99]|nr:ribonuclease HII [beta proteobacterium AAP99]